MQDLILFFRLFFTSALSLVFSLSFFASRNKLKAVGLRLGIAHLSVSKGIIIPQGSCAFTTHWQVQGNLEIIYNDGPTSGWGVASFAAEAGSTLLSPHMLCRVAPRINVPFPVLMAAPRQQSLKTIQRGWKALEATQLLTERCQEEDGEEISSHIFCSPLDVVSQWKIRGVTVPWHRLNDTEK